MKTAQQIAQQHANLDAAQTAAEASAIAKDQIWEGEGYTILVFDDNSFLAQSGVEQIAVDGDDEMSVRKYIAWLGEDAKHDSQRIENLLEAMP